MTNDELRLRLADYLSHMLEAARLAREYVENTVKADFLNDRRTQQAVVLNLITIGEAPRALSATTAILPQLIQRSRGPKCEACATAWRMTHGYFDIDLNIVWDTVKSSLPELERQLVPLVSQPTS
jgi:uncharacterized protein with HEPN domain